MWNEFNIKTFPAETIVYRNGEYCPDLSTIADGAIDKKYKTPVHIIYIGDIAGENNLNINLSADDQPVFLSVNIKNEKPAFLNIFIKNTGKNSEIRGHILMENHSDLKYKCTAHHAAANTGILLKNKLIAKNKSQSSLSAVAIIANDCDGCISDIGFAALAARDAKIEFTPAQRISSIPAAADHSAAIYSPNFSQIQFLRQAGLATAEVDDALREAFINDFPLF